MEEDRQIIPMIESLNQSFFTKPKRGSTKTTQGTTEDSRSKTILKGQPGQNAKGGKGESSKDSKGKRKWTEQPPPLGRDKFTKGGKGNKGGGSSAEESYLRLNDKVWSLGHRMDGLNSTLREQRIESQKIDDVLKRLEAAEAKCTKLATEVTLLRDKLSQAVPVPDSVNTRLETTSLQLERQMTDVKHAGDILSIKVGEISRRVDLLSNQQWQSQMPMQQPMMWTQPQVPSQGMQQQQFMLPAQPQSVPLQHVGQATGYCQQTGPPTYEQGQGHHKVAAGQTTYSANPYAGSANAPP